MLGFGLRKNMKFRKERRKKVSDLLGSLGLMISATLVVSQFMERKLPESSIIIAGLIALLLLILSVIIIKED